MIDRTAQTPPLTLGQKIVAWWETSTSVSEPADLAERIDAELASEHERGKRHGADDRKMIELQNQRQGREIDREEIAMSKTDAEIVRPGMPAEERIARMISRGLGHNDENGMDWERYALAARCILRNCKVVFPK